AEVGRPPEVTNKRMQRRVLIVRRADEPKPYVRRVAELLLECRDQTRLADSGFAGQQDDPALAVLGLLPATHQERGLFRATDQSDLVGAQRLESAVERAFAEHGPDADRGAQSLQIAWAKVAVVEQSPGQEVGRLVDHDHARLGQRLQPSGKI